jgi:hypothetical protein
MNFIILSLFLVILRVCYARHNTIEIAIVIINNLQPGKYAGYINQINALLIKSKFKKING